MFALVQMSVVVLGSWMQSLRESASYHRKWICRVIHEIYHKMMVARSGPIISTCGPIRETLSRGQPAAFAFARRGLKRDPAECGAFALGDWFKQRGQNRAVVGCHAVVQ